MTLFYKSIDYYVVTIHYIFGKILRRQKIRAKGEMYVYSRSKRSTSAVRSPTFSTDTSVPGGR